MKLLKQLLETSTAQQAQTPAQRNLELLFKQKRTLEAKVEALFLKSSVFEKLMPGSHRMTNGVMLSTYGTIIDIRNADSWDTATEWAEHYGSHTEQMALNFFNHPAGYFVVETQDKGAFRVNRGNISMSATASKQPLICIANKEVMKKAGLDEDDFLLYVERDMIRTQAKRRLLIIDHRINAAFMEG